MTIHTANEALTIWGAWAFAGGRPVDRLSPKGLERRGAVHGFTDEEQVVAFVERIEGFEGCRRFLFSRWAMGQRANIWKDGERAKVAEFRARLQESIGKGFHTVPPTPEWCPADDPRITVTNDGRTLV